MDLDLTAQLNAIARLEGLSCPDWTVEAIQHDALAGESCCIDYRHGLAMCRLRNEDDEDAVCIECAVRTLRTWYLVQGAHITVEVFR